MKRIFILVYRGRGPFAAAIRKFGRKRHAHAAVVLADAPRSTGILYEAVTEAGVIRRHVNNLDCLPDVDWLEYEIPLWPEEVQAAVQFLDAQVGKSYDGNNILAFLLRMDMSGEEIQRERQNREQWHCSELVAGMAEYITARCMRRNRRLLRHTMPFEVDPGDVYRSMALAEAACPTV